MRHIYEELSKKRGRLTDFANFLISKKVFTDTSNCLTFLRNGTAYRQDIQDLYDSWKDGKLKTKDINKYNEKVSNVFKDIKKTKVKKELESIVEVLEESLKELTIAIKNDDKSKLLEAKEMLQNALYGSK